MPPSGITPAPPTRQQHQRQRQQKQQPHHPKHIAEGKQRGLTAHLVTEQLQGLIGDPAGALAPFQHQGLQLGQPLLQQRIGHRQVLHQVAAMQRAALVENHRQQGDAKRANTSNRLP